MIFMKKLSLLGVTLALLALAAPPTRAATYTWTGAGFMGNQDFLWSNPFNWAGLAAPATGESNLIIILPNNAAPRTTTNDVAGLTAKSIRFQGDNYIVAGKSPGHILALTFDRLSGDTIEATGDDGQFAGNLTLVLTNSITVDVDPLRTFVIRSAMTGHGGVTKTDAGTLHFNSFGNSYGGDTFIADGILDLQCAFFGPSLAVPGALIIGSTNLAFSPVVRLLNDDQIANTAPIAVNANGKLWLNTHDDTVGPITLVGGLVNTGLGGGTSTPGLLTLNGNVTNRASGVNPFSTISGRLSLDLITRVIDVGTNSELGINANISGAPGLFSGLTKTGPGQLTLYNATNTYNGVTTVDGGRLLLVGGHQLLGNTNSGTVVNTGGQLHLIDVVVGQESLILNGTLTSDALRFEGSNHWAGPLVANAACVHGASNQFLTLPGVVSGGALKTTGPGKVYLTGPNPNTVFDLIVDRGEVILNKPAGVDAFGGRVHVGNTNDAQFAALLTIRAHQQFPFAAPTTVFRSGVIVTDNANEVLGPVTLHGGWLVNFGGKFTLNGNVTNLYHPAQSGFITGELVLGNFQRTVHCAANSTLHIGALVSDPGGAGGLTKTGPGRLILSNTNTYAGPTLAQDGFLVLEESGRPGSTAAGTEVQPAAVLQLTQAHITNEPLTLHGHAANYSVYVRDQCTWAGPVSLLGEAGIQFEIANGLTNRLTIDGSVVGPGGGRVDGDGTVVLTGATDNTFAGRLWFRSADGRLQKSGGATAVGSALRIGIDDINGIFPTVTLGAANQIGNTTPVQMEASGVLDIGTFNDTVGPLLLAGGDIEGTTGVLTLNGDVTSVDNSSTSYVEARLSLGGATRTFDLVSGGHVVFEEPIEDGGVPAGLIKTGSGILSFTAFNTYSGATLVNEGRLELVGIGRPGSPAAGTTVATDGRIEFINSRITNELLVLDSTIAFFKDTNEWHGPVQLSGAATLKSRNELGRWLITGTISGSGGFTLQGGGVLTLQGNTPNAYGGHTTLDHGQLVLGKSSGPAIPGDLTVGTTNTALDAIVTTTAAHQFNADPARHHLFLPSGQLICSGFDQRIPRLTLIEGFINTSGGLLSLHGDVQIGENTTSGSSIHGRLALGSPLATGAERTLTITNGVNLNLFAEITDGGPTTNLFVTGGGNLFLDASNSFSGLFHALGGGCFVSDPFAFGRPGVGADFATNTFVNFLDLGTNHMPEPMTFHGTTDLNTYAISTHGTNHLSGPIRIDGYVRASVTGLLVCSGPLGGTNGSFVIESDTVRLTGTNANTFTGPLRFWAGTLELAKTNATAIAGPLEVGATFGSPAEVLVRWVQPHQVSDVSTVQVKLTGQLELQHQNDTIGSITGGGGVLLGSATLTTGGDGTSTTFDGLISGLGGVTKTGPGTFTLTASNTYTGATTVNGGVLRVQGQQAQSAVSLLTGGTIGGSGRVGNISALNGHVAPGASPGNLTSGNLSFFSPASLLQIEVNGTNPGVSYDQVDVTGTVLLMGGALQLSMNFAGAVSNQYVIVNNDGADPVNGTFTALPEGGSLTNNGFVFTISYHGGDGNDIVLTQQTVATGPQIALIQKRPDGSMQFNGTGLPNTAYTVEATTSLNLPVQWDELGGVNSDGAGLLQFIDTEAPHFPMRFYRFRLP